MGDIQTRENGVHHYSEHNVDGRAVFNELADEWK